MCLLLSQILTVSSARADPTPPPKTVTIAGTFQDELGCPGASRSTPNKSLVIASANIQGTMTQLNKPPTSQYVSHDQRLTAR